MKQHNKRPVFLNLLQIQMPVTALLSIAHRITGVLLSLFIVWLILVLDLSLRGPDGFERVAQMFADPWLRVALAFVSWGLAHHLFSGLRFLLIDLEIGVDRASARISALAVNVAGFLVFLMALGVML